MWESAFRWEGFRGNPLRIMGTPPCFPLKQRSRKKENKASNNNTRKFHLPLSSSLLRWSQWHLVATPTSDPWTQPLQPPFSFFFGVRALGLNFKCSPPNWTWIRCLSRKTRTPGHNANISAFPPFHEKH